MKLDPRHTPPIIEKRPHKIVQHGYTRFDDYAWLRADNWREVMQNPSLLASDIRTMLEAENSYYKSVTAPLSGLTQDIFEEMKGRIEPIDSDVPTPDGRYAYYHKYREGDQHGVFMRAILKDREKLLLGHEDILLDADALSKNYPGFFNLGSVEHSPNHEHIAYSVDSQGAENYEIFIQALDSDLDKNLIKTGITRCAGGVQWAHDSRTIFWIERDDNQRPCFVYAKDAFDPQTPPRLIYKEDDPAFFVSLSESDSGRYIQINVHNHTTSEIWLIPSDRPAEPPVCFAPRLAGCEYSLCDHDNQFYILTNYQSAVDFQIMTCPALMTSRENWDIYEPHKSGRLILSLTLFENHLVRVERESALPRLVITDLKDNQSHIIEFDEAAYSLGFMPGLEYKTDIMRFSYSSPTTPNQVFDYNMKSHKRVLRKTRNVPSGHAPNDYIADRIMVTARDGAEIPVTLVYNASTRQDGTAPCLLYGYGSYGHTIPASFRTSLLSLLDRGFVYAIAHIRGSQAKGYQWYLDGKLEKKINSFNDFVDVGRELISQNFTSKGRIVAHGGSAGGLLVGAAVNQAPELFAGVIGDVPFVDVLTTISDDSLPLTPPEWPEWGNPITDKSAYELIASYSPYDKVDAKTYPAILITAGLTDPRVTYWEPAKWAAKLREYQQGNAPILLKTNMSAGHAGESGRYDALKDLAEEYAFAVAVTHQD